MDVVSLPTRSALLSALAFSVIACNGGSNPTSGGSTKGAGGASGSAGMGGMGSAAGGGGAGGEMVDAGCPADAGWSMPGMPPNGPDSDGDGYSDCDEAACGSNPNDVMSKCYACGWKHNDPGTLKSTGAAEGDVIANLDLVDQCQEPLKLWDFAGEYHILFMTAAW